MFTIENRVRNEDLFLDERMRVINYNKNNDANRCPRP